MENGNRILLYLYIKIYIQKFKNLNPQQISIVVTFYKFASFGFVVTCKIAIVENSWNMVYEFKTVIFI